jgi:hypothetical protein
LNPTAATSLPSPKLNSTKRRRKKQTNRNQTSAKHWKNQVIFRIVTRKGYFPEEISVQSAKYVVDTKGILQICCVSDDCGTQCEGYKDDMPLCMFRLNPDNEGKKNSRKKRIVWTPKLQKELIRLAKKHKTRGTVLSWPGLMQEEGPLKEAGFDLLQLQTKIKRMNKAGVFQTHN